MKGFLDSLLVQLEIVLNGVSEYFKESPMSTVFFVFIILVFVLNITKGFLVWLEKKRGTPYQSCKYLIEEDNEQDCSHLSHRKYFKSNENGCEGCRGKSFKMTDAEAEYRVADGNLCKRIIILLANYSKNMLPYISFIYTLVVTIFENNK